MDHYSCSNKSQPHAICFGHITVEGQLVEEALLRVVQAQTHLSKEHQMHVVHFIKTLPCPSPMGRQCLTHWESDTCPFPPLLKDVGLNEENTHFNSTMEAFFPPLLSL